MVAHLAGASAGADLLAAALRGANILQNLLGEQALSAAFIPIYSRFLEEGRTADARRFASAISGLLLVVAGGLALAGVLAAPLLVSVLAPGWRTEPELFGPLVEATRIVLPMTAVLVLAAWCLAILNSHRRFFLPYIAPVMWNVAVIAALLIVARSLAGGALPPSRLVIAGSVGALVGGVLQLAVQLPLALRLLGGWRPSLTLAAPGVRDALRAFAPVATARGVVQISGYLELLLISWLAIGSFSSATWAQRIFLLAVALFGTAFAVVELPELSRIDTTVALESFRRRMSESLDWVVFFSVPTALGFVVFGHLIVATLYRSGRFGAEDNWLVYLILAAYAVGLVATSSSRILQNGYYALRDTSTPARIAVLRVFLGATVGLVLMLFLERYRVVDIASVASSKGLRLGVVGMALGSALAAWIEWWALRRGLGRRLGASGLQARQLALYLAAAVLTALVAAAAWYSLRSVHPLLLGPAVITVYAGGYFGVGHLFGLRHPRELGRRLGLGGKQDG